MPEEPQASEPDNQKTNYQGNSHKQKQQAQKGRESRNVEKVVVNEVLMPKESVVSKFRDTFFAGDLRSVSQYVFWDVMIPAAKNMLWDALSRGSDKWIFGDPSSRYRDRDGSVMSRISYNRPVNRDSREYQDPRETRGGSRRELGPRRSGRAGRTDYLFTDKEDAERVLEDLVGALEDYPDVSLGDFLELMGRPHNHVDNNWVWTNLNGVKIVQTREGYFIDFPPLQYLD